MDGEPDPRTFEELLKTVTAKTKSNVQATQKIYNVMAQALYRELAESPAGTTKHFCAISAAKQLKKSAGIDATEANILRRTGAIDQELLEKLRSKVDSEQTN